MVLKTEIVKIGDREIVIKETSFAAQMRLEALEKITTRDLYKEAMSEEDFKFMEEIGKEDSIKIVDAFTKVNSVGEDKSPIKKES